MPKATWRPGRSSDGVCDSAGHPRQPGARAGAVRAGLSARGGRLEGEAKWLEKRITLRVLRRVNADGLNEILQEDFRALTPEERDAWFRYHLYLSEQPRHLGACNRWLYVCEPM